MSKILVLGGTGAMGIYLVPNLISKGHYVDVVSLDDKESDNPRLTYSKGDAKDIEYIKKILANKYDAIVDFLIYPENQFNQRMELFLDNTKHYIYLSTYRIYNDLEHPIKETSPRLLDTATDKEYLESAPFEYSLYKAKGEDLLRNSKYSNYTIIRPSIIFSTCRFPLVTLEANTVIQRMSQGKTIVLPEQAMDVEATIAWAGDAARMIASIVLNEKAYGETYTIATSEHHTWRTIADYYKELCGLKYVTVPEEDFLGIVTNYSYNKHARYQLEFDRMFTRIIDNSKILNLMGEKQSDLMTIKNGLKLELENISKLTAYPWREDKELNNRMDNYLKEHGIE